MAGYGLAVEFKEYKDIDCDIVFNDTSKAPSFDGSADPKFPTTYNYFGIQETAEPIKNKYIYIFQKHSNGNAYLNREMKGTSSGKLDIYDIEDWENADSRDIKSSGFSRIYFDENSLKNGSMYYFCLSRIQWSKERLKLVRDQLKAGYCKRLIKLPIHSKYASRYSDEEKKDVNYAIAEANSGYLLTEVFLFDYWKYIYDGSVGLKKLLNDAMDAMEVWMTEPVDNAEIGEKREKRDIHRHELKALNDAIWHISSIGTKKIDLNLISMHIDQFFKSFPEVLAQSSMYNNYGAYGYPSGPAINPSFFTENNLSYWRSDTFKAYKERVDNYNVYHNHLKKLDEENDSDKLRELGEHPKNQDWTDAEYWMIKYSEGKVEKFSDIDKYSNLITHWIIKKEFIAMQHDYAHGSEEEQGGQFEDFSSVLQMIVNTPAGRRHIVKESDNCLRVLDKLNFDNDNEQHINDILEKDLSKDGNDITVEEQRELFDAIEKQNKESSYLATSFFTMRKMELGAFYALEALSVLGKPVKEYVEKTYFATVIDDITMSFMKVKRGAVDGHQLCVKLANLNSTPWWKKHGVKNEDDWLEYIKKRYNLDSKNIKLEVKGEYVFAKEVNIKYKLETFTDFDEVIVKAEKFKIAKAIRKSEWIPRIVISFEVFNVMLAISNLATNKNVYDEFAGYLSLAGALVDVSAFIAEFAKKKALGGVLGIVSGVLEAGVNIALAMKKGAVNDDFAERAYYCAAFGSILVAIGTAGSLFLAGPPGAIAGIIIIIGIVLQIIGTLLATLFALDDIENWVRFCYWGDSVNNLPCSIPLFSDTCFSEWKNDLPVQLEAYNFLAYGFNIVFKAWFNDLAFEGELHGGLKITITPNLILDSSKLKVSIWLENDDEQKDILINNKLIAFDKKQYELGGRDYIYPYVKKNDKNRVTEIVFGWFNPEFENSRHYRYWAHDENLPKDKITKIEDFGNMLRRENKFLHVEASLDFYGNGALIIPGKDKKVILHREISDSSNLIFYGREIGISEKKCGKHEKD